MNNVLKYREDIIEAEMPKRSNRSVKRKQKMMKRGNIDEIDDDSTPKIKKPRLKRNGIVVGLKKEIDIKKRSESTNIDERSAKQAKIMDEFFKNVREEKEERVNSIEVSRLMIMKNKNKNKSKEKKNRRKNRKKNENQEINGKEKKNNEKDKKKRKQDKMDEINDDGWIVKKKIKRSTTEAEDIRRYFRTEDKH
jgi:hypothetical protein